MHVIAELSYTQHEGSGFTFTKADVEEMTPFEWMYYLDWLTERRREEAEAIRKAYRKK